MSVVPVTPRPGDMLKIVALLSAPVLGFLVAFSGLGYGVPVCVLFSPVALAYGVFALFEGRDPFMC